MSSDNDEPIEVEYRAMMNTLAKGLDEIFNGPLHGKDRHTGFVLLVFPMNDEPSKDKTRCNFISNGANRKDLAAMFKELIARWEHQPMPPETTQ